MLGQPRKKWLYFENGLMAKQKEDAYLLKNWYFKQSIAFRIADHFLLLNLHNNKIISDRNKVNIALREQKNEPFIFFFCKN
jgi:hypothetical protein